MAHSEGAAKQISQQHRDEDLALLGKAWWRPETEKRKALIGARAAGIKKNT